jgi:PAS domain S-box-containing protein
VASILLVDDHVVNLTALEAVLSPLGHRLVRAQSGEQALRAVKREDFAVILLDVHMPGMDGFETARLIKARPRSSKTPIIFLTAADVDQATMARAYTQGAVDFLQKPFEPSQLRSKVAVFVELFQQADEIRRQAVLLRRRERERFEEQVASRFRGLTDLLPLCVWAATRDGRIHYCNKAWLLYTGLQRDHANQVDHLEVIHADDRERVKEAWRGAVEDGDELVVEYRLRRASDGSYRWHLGRAVPELGPRGGIVGWVATATDIEDQKQSEQMLGELADRAQSARIDAEAANRMKDQFLATVSHELRTPLNAIFGWVRLMRAGKLDRADVTKALETIERNTRMQTQLVEDLLDVSRIVSGKLRLDLRPLNPVEVVRAAIEATRLTADAKGVALEASIDPVPCRLDGDANRLEQVVWNLLSNAIKFTPKGGRVDIAVRVEGIGHVAIEVTDTGHGIEADFLPFVFDRFRQADSSTRRQQGGLGLGLAIVRHIVELHRGECEVESPGYGQGARFTVRLPVVSVGEVSGPVSMATRESGSFAEIATLRGLTVVIVDDDDDARELMATVLEGYGAEVTSCHDAASAFDEVCKKSPHMLLSDIGMPGENGYDLIRRIRALPAEQGGRVIAVALTGFARSEDGAEAISAGFQLHLAKPIDPAHLLATLHKLIADHEISLKKSARFTVV